MAKYWQLLKLSWENGLVYRTSVLLWRFRQLLSTLMSLTLWTVVFSATQSAFSYSQQEMITYIFLAAFLQSAILTTALNGLANTIYSGELSRLLIKPINIYAYFASEDIADKLKNVGFLVVETIILFFIFKPVFVLPDAFTLVLFLFWLAGGIILHFLITLLFGAIGFWSPDVWGPRFLFFLIVGFTAGKLFPLDILPQAIQQIIYLTPFPYFAFMQSQLFLGKLSDAELIRHTISLSLWIVGMVFVVHKIWQRGIKDYSAVGQ